MCDDSIDEPMTCAPGTVCIDTKNAASKMDVLIASLVKLLSSVDEVDANPHSIAVSVSMHTVPGAHVIGSSIESSHITKAVEEEQ
jgi:hypothetical protein